MHVRFFVQILKIKILVPGCVCSCGLHAAQPGDMQGALSVLRLSINHSSQFKNNYFTEMCSGSEEGSYLRPTFVSLNSRLESNKEERKKEATPATNCGWGGVGGGCNTRGGQTLSRAKCAPARHTRGLHLVWGLGLRVEG